LTSPLSAHAQVGGIVCSPICFTDQGGNMLAVLDDTGPKEPVPFLAIQAN
jgi:hypothetical protein